MQILASLPHAVDAEVVPRPARRACADLAREEAGDQSLGKLLSHAPNGQDGVWPSEPLREVLERIRSEDISAGITIGLFNARGAQWRGKGGDQERDLAAMYRKWVNALQFSHPFVVSSILKRMVDTYVSQAQSYDSEDEIQQRMGH
jgi:hypothetical protein